MTASLVPDTAELSALAEKYETLARLRRERNAGEARPAKADFQRIAARFPGALYELDTLPLDVIIERAAALRDASARCDATVPAWMGWMARFHQLMRDELQRRREGGVSVGPRLPATARAIAAIAKEASTSQETIEAALFTRKRRGVSR